MTPMRAIMQMTASIPAKIRMEIVASSGTVMNSSTNRRPPMMIIKSRISEVTFDTKRMARKMRKRRRSSSGFTILIDKKVSLIIGSDF